MIAREQLLIMPWWTRRTLRRRNGDGAVERGMSCGERSSARVADRGRCQLHREILGLTLGDGLEGDHIDGNRLDCRRSNLRVATKPQNAQNKPSNGGSSKYRGVSYVKTSRKWRADAGLNGGRNYLGCFDSEEAAAAAVSAFRIANMPFTNEARRDQRGPKI